MSRAAKATLVGAIALSTFTVWFVHFQQNQEHENMYKGVLRDDERRLEKKRQREEDLKESLRKRELYERVQPVRSQQDT
ncbi:hypothetical protein PLICRDRAFT_177100 [Plicaturopsis crispa FD-325 SS-3]|nr:hypothetical protein PLICRDRAFT_177100 [Plicaturopsis crispa FD-325 SS-3]